MSKKNLEDLLQPWVMTLSVEEFCELIACVRDQDNLSIFSGLVGLNRWLRRCFMKDRVTGEVYNNPCSPGGGPLIGPTIMPTTTHPFYAVSVGIKEQTWQEQMEHTRLLAISELEQQPHTYFRHFLAGVSVIARHHPVEEVAAWWRRLRVDLMSRLHTLDEFEKDYNAVYGNPSMTDTT